MAYEDQQPEFPVGDNSKKSSRFLPRYFRTSTNEKLTSSTIDQLFSSGAVEKINAFVGRRNAKANANNSTYLTEINSLRSNYQLDPSVNIRDDLGNITFHKDYIDYIGQIKSFYSNTSNHSKLNEQEIYSWNPHIDFDKFTNFREYYWLPNGPQVVTVPGNSRDVESTYKINVVEETDNFAYLFTPDKLTRNPLLNLYRGQTYRFEIDAEGSPFAFAISREFLPGLTFEDSVTNESTLYTDGIVTTGADADGYVSKGVIEFTVPDNAPDELFYISKEDINTSGLIRISTIEENSFIDIDKEILGKVSYKTADGWNLSNGMKVQFTGTVIPEKYQDGVFYVEGVGKEIILVPVDDLSTADLLLGDEDVAFDVYGFDRLPWSTALGYPAVKDYIVSNRSSIDKNPWARYNRWFHISVIEQSAKINNQDYTLPANSRGKRPIIEFKPGIKMYHNGTVCKDPIDLIDDWTNDIFSIIEGQEGYNIDNVNLVDGMRILFTNDSDTVVNNKIYVVNFIKFQNKTQISLIEATDSTASENDIVLIKDGKVNAGKQYFFDGTKWKKAQEKTSVNQTPVFDIFDKTETSYSNTTYYESTTFTGNKIFAYKEGTGALDSELGFPVTYKNIDNVGDIVFEFDLLAQKDSYIQNEENIDLFASQGFVKITDSYDKETLYENAWKKHYTKSKQAVIIDVQGVNQTNNFEIDCFTKSNTLSDLKLKIFTNRKFLKEGIDYTLGATLTENVLVTLTTPIESDDRIIIKCYTSTDKNDNAYYETAYNLERNPNNLDVKEFTIGEVNDHVQTIVENIENFEGIHPGVGNLRDKGNIEIYGDRFVTHAGPIGLPLYHFTSKEHNIVNSIKLALQEYSKFKREFLRLATYDGYNNTVEKHVDYLLAQFATSKTRLDAYYDSDVVPFGAKTIIEYTVLDSGNPYFPLTTAFNLNELNHKAVLVYNNNVQLTYIKDYMFTDEGFVNIPGVENDDIIHIHEFETTDGCFVPPTPSKLGLYPLYEPQIILDNTFSTPTKVIQGHDGSRTVAFNDFRDDLLIELEKRIFNNVKTRYNAELFDIFDYIPGRFRSTGLARNDIENIMIADFINWTNVAQVYDFNENKNIDISDSFSYNYRNTSDISGKQLEGFWRAVYNNAYDTDTPNLTPWKMLGFSIQPSWWETVYGPAPYTSNNIPLWKDLEAGIIREPGKLIRKDIRFARPNLTSQIPTDENGRIRSPFETGFSKDFSFSSQEGYTFEFGDQGPAETAWRRSSEYPFSLLNALLLLKPAKVFGYAYDYSKISRSLSGNLIYNHKNAISAKEIDFVNPSAGLLNYVKDYIKYNNMSFDDYKNNIANLRYNLSFRLAGFSDKEKVNLVLDSKTPNSSGDIFTPQENYNLFLKTSSPIDVVTYSGVVIEKVSTGYKINGYDRNNPKFTYNKVIESANDPFITVGGISEEFAEWAAEKLYVAGGIVRYSQKFYRVNETHTSVDEFESAKFSELAELPTVGGRAGRFSKRFSASVSYLQYGTVLPRYQDVIDFLLGYDKALQDLGFRFDYNNAKYGIVENFRLAAKEFLFWTTQNWGDQSVISLSPSANKIVFKRDFYLPDNLYDSIFNYEILDQDGKLFKTDFVNLVRETDNTFSLASNDEGTGVYFVRLFLVQKEHCIVIDNDTVFADTIYNETSGYRQERLKVIGYRTADWSGTLNIPGFVFDEPKATKWKSFSDYIIGDVIAYKDKYYTATLSHTSGEFFDQTNWTVLTETPKNQLIPNFDYRASQFADFYDLDTDNFDTEQQRLAQHLIGYQKREYLKNIINDEISQYKFYQGMIQDKGTKNVLTKLFDKLSSSGKDSIEFFEEWAIRAGQYGATDSFEEFEITIDESKYKLTPQPFELVSSVDKTRSDFIYQVPRSDIKIKPANYNNKLFPFAEYEEVTKTAGYVAPAQIDFITSGVDQLLGFDISLVKQGQYVWVTNDKLSWNVYEFKKTNYQVESITKTLTGFKVSLDSNHNLKSGDIIGLTNINDELDGFRQVIYTGYKELEFYTEENITEDIDLSDSSAGIVIQVAPRRFTNLDDYNTILRNTDVQVGNKAWIDDIGNNKWAVLENKPVYDVEDIVVNPQTGLVTNFGDSLAVNQTNTKLAVGDPNTNGRVIVYTRIGDGGDFSSPENYQADTSVVGTNSQFGASVALSPSGDFLFVGAPNAANLRTRYKGNILPGTSYSAGEIVNDRGTLWRAKVDVDGSDVSTINKMSQDWERANLIDVDPNGSLTGSILGAVCVYKKEDVGNEYELVTTILSPEPVSDDNFGRIVKCRKDIDGVLRLYIASNEAEGRIYFFDNDTTDGSWKYSRDDNYRGTFNPTENYIQGEIVWYNSTGGADGNRHLWRANKDLPAQSFSETNWELLDQYVDHKGYIPPQNELLNDESDNLGVAGGQKIATSFDVSVDGEVLVVNGEDTLNTNVVSVYRRVNNRYAYYETIETANLAQEFGSEVAVSANGNAIAINAIRNDDTGTNNGAVFVYRYTGNEYGLNQTLYPPTGVSGELFGISLNFSEENLIIASANGSRFLPTLFDQTIIRSNDTSFDKNTTKFFNKFPNAGTVYIFQNFNNNYLYAEELDWNYDTKNSSTPVLLTNANHIYISYPRLEYTADYGVVLDIKRDKQNYSWTKLSEQIDTPDISKIKRAFLFDKNTNDIVTFLDVIDPIQGKIAGVADEAIDLKLAFDPASYSVDTTTLNNQDFWASEYVGTYWWNTESTKWYNPFQGNAETQTSFWNKLLPDSDTQVYEWVESDYIPSEYDELADTNEGIELGISGFSKYGDFKYSVGRKYNAVTETFNTKYYFWVQNNRLLSNTNKKISSYDAEQLITDPQSAGYVFMSALSTDKFALHNVQPFVKDKDIALHIDVYKGEINDRNIHTEYKLLSEGLAGSNPPDTFIEKWIDSLVGYDKNLRPVPDSELGESKKYGIENRPRQGLFRNSSEALKQTIERINYILRQQIITDFKDLKDLDKNDIKPRLLEGIFDVEVATLDEITNIGVANAKLAVITPTLLDGKLVSVSIDEQGYGYKSAPKVIITGNGTEAEIQTTIDNLGRVIGATIINTGKNYSSINVAVRPFTFLVTNDSTINGKWALYEYDYSSKYNRVQYQKWNVANFWNYADWYATGYDENTSINYLIDGSYQLDGLNDIIGDVVKIKDIGTGGWLLLQKIDVQTEVDYTVNYKTVGRQNGTIQFSSKLYQNTNFGFDKVGFDNLVYDTEPVNERRIILQTLKDKVFIDDLSIKFNDILFTAIRYALYEQQTVDWIFKTSFLTAKHNIGMFDQRTNFKSDNLDSYKDFINEVKPYSSKIREYISAYENLENSQTLTTDFDLPPRYDDIQNKIVTETIKFYNSNVVGNREFVNTYPQKNWLDNYKFKIKELVIHDAGYGLLNQPVVTISGGNGPTLTGKGYRTGDKLTSIDIAYDEAVYTSQPTITINGSFADDYKLPVVIAILGDSPVRSTHMTMKFDRVSGNFVFTDLKTVETFTGTGAKKSFNTKWPLDLRKSRVNVTVDGNNVLYTDYTLSNVKDTTKTYSRNLGNLSFETAPANNATIEITYYKDPAMLSAADRINAFYNPKEGMPGITKNEDGTINLGQLMTGIDYEGVNIESVDFSTDQGFDVGGFGIIPWDIFSQSEDEIFVLDGSTLVFTLSKPLEDGVSYNIYKNNVRIDDPNFDGSSVIINKNALMNTIYGDGIQDTIPIDDTIPTAAGDIFIVRKETSDGSFEPADNVLDTELSGGGYNNTAKGLESGEITVDGDGFVTQTTNAGPEEVVPGQIVDTLDIQVKHKPADGQGIKTSYIYKTKSSILSYPIDMLPQSQQAVIVNINGQKVVDDSYKIDYENNLLTFEDDSTIQDDMDLHILVIGNNGTDILESDTFIGDGVTSIFVTGVTYTNPISSFVTINGVVQQSSFAYEVFETDATYKNEKCAAIRFGTPPRAGEVIGFSLYNNDSKSFSEITVDKSFIGDGVNYVYKFNNNTPFTEKPFTHKMLVKQGDKFLNAGYNIRHVLTNDRVYGIQTWQFEQPTKISNDDVLVLLNNKILIDAVDYRWDAINSRIEFLNPLLGEVGDVLEIYVLGNGEYYFIDTVVDLTDMEDSTKQGLLHDEGDLISFVMEDSTQIFATVKSSVETDTGVTLTLNGYFKELKVKAAENDVPLQLTGVKDESYPAAIRIDNVRFVESENLTFKTVPAVNEKVEIITFSEHDVNNFDRLSFEVLYSPVISSSSPEYPTAISLTNGRIKLNQPAAGVNYVWVIQNNRLLRPSVDYELVSDNSIVNLFAKPQDNEIIEIIQFAAKLTTTKYGFRIFKDMLNRVHYKRLNEKSVVKLSQPLNFYDQFISVEDTTNLPIPNRTTGKPGVVFIEGERIEYYVLEGNLLRQIRRGTLGTGVKSQYPAGTILMEQGERETIPYTDKDLTQIFVSDGSTNIYTMDFDITSYNEIEVVVGGKKLRKPATQDFKVFNKTIDQDSPEADETELPEFTINPDDNTITLRDDAPTGVRIVVQRKEGKLWTDDLSISDAKIARFVRAGTIKLSK